ncbi:MAG: cytochrome c [Burkholderiaceae bacterium]
MNRRTSRRAARLLALGLCALSMGRAAAQMSEPPFDLTQAAVIASGEALFNRRCAGKCHGRDAYAGEDAPSLYGRSHLTPPIAYVMINYGKPSTAMPPWKDRLTDEEIWRLVAYVVSLQRP